MFARECVEFANDSSKFLAFKLGDLQLQLCNQCYRSKEVGIFHNETIKGTACLISADMLHVLGLLRKVIYLYSFNTRRFSAPEYANIKTCFRINYTINTCYPTGRFLVLRELHKTDSLSKCLTVMR